MGFGGGGSASHQRSCGCPSSSAAPPLTQSEASQIGAGDAAGGAIGGAVFGATAGATEGGASIIAGLFAVDGLYSGAMAGILAGGAIGIGVSTVLVGGPTWPVSRRGRSHPLAAATRPCFPSGERLPVIAMSNPLVRLRNYISTKQNFVKASVIGMGCPFAVIAAIWLSKFGSVMPFFGAILNWVVHLRSRDVGCHVPRPICPQAGIEGTGWLR
jgi:hypothetical protein